jgi:hypothetical protein
VVSWNSSFHLPCRFTVCNNGSKPHVDSTQRCCRSAPTCPHSWSEHSSARHPDSRIAGLDGISDSSAPAQTQRGRGLVVLCQPQLLHNTDPLESSQSCISRCCMTSVSRHGGRSRKTELLQNSAKHCCSSRAEYRIYCISPN